MAHKDTRILLEVEGRRFVVLGFLNDKEGEISGDEMLRRTDGENDKAIDEDDFSFLEKHARKFLDQWQVLIGYGHWLMTHRRDPEDSRYISCFCGSGQMIGEWVTFSLKIPVFADCFVLRRLP